jgi:hypothetical protein
MALALPAQASPRPADLVAEALSAGLQAEAQQDGPAMLRAAERLDSLGAHPETGEDIAAYWRKAAVGLGADIRTTVSRGRTLGPAYSARDVAAMGRFATHQSFNAGEKANIAVVSPGGENLQLSVIDDDGAPACRQSRVSKRISCTWVPLWTGLFRIEVENAGDRPARFYLITN